MGIDIRVGNSDDFDNTEIPGASRKITATMKENLVQESPVSVHGGENSERSPVPAIEELELRLCLRDLMDGAPSDSVAVFFVRQTSRGYKGILKIRSVTGRFVAGCVAHELDELIETISQQIRVQLSEWRRNRRFV